MTAQTYDAIVIGARCAGAATAMLMARQGMRVLLVERGEPGADTVSSHNLTRGAVVQLARWGIAERLLDRGTPRIERTTFHFGDRVLPIDLKPVMGASGILGPRRPVLDLALAEAAAEAGADVRYHMSFRDAIRDPSGRVAGAILTDGAGIDIAVDAKLLIGADGLRSTVARRVGAAIRKEAKHALGHIYGYFSGLPLSDNHGFFAPGLMVGSMPTNGGATVVIASTHEASLRGLRSEMTDEHALRNLAQRANESFGALLDDAHLTEAPKVFTGVKGFVRDCAGPGWALVGDAGYFRDPVTAHGITDAFRDAELLANAAAARSDEALARYQVQRDEVTAEIFDLTDRIAAFDMPMADLAEAFHDLSRAMRTEQDWMQVQFAGRLRAA